MGDVILTVAQWASALSGIVACAVLLIKPLREKVIGVGLVRDGLKCLLRQQMLATYYHHKDDKTIRQFEYENFMMSYIAYKALHGNSFIDKIKAEVETWEVVS